MKIDPQNIQLAEQLENLAQRLRESPNIIIKSNRLSKVTFPGEPTLFTGQVKLSVELLDPSLKTTAN